MMRRLHLPLLVLALAPAFILELHSEQRRPVHDYVIKSGPPEGDEPTSYPDVQILFRQAVLRLAQAAALRLPGAGVDSNSPAHWDGEQLYVFTSWYRPYGSIVRSSGSDVADLDGPLAVAIRDRNPSVTGGQWLEATYKEPDGPLFGWYHLEPGIVCPGTSLTAPRIGALLSFDNGLSWFDLGAILDAPAGSLNCRARNGYFAGGHGDFSVILDAEQNFFYFLFGNYSGTVEEQGVAIARMSYADRLAPAGAVVKWYNGGWTEPGLGGRVTPLLPAARSWANADPDAFWGPSVHFNTHLQTYVILLNRTRGGNGDWRQEGIYAVLADQVGDPNAWTKPQRLLEGGDWYPQVLGTDGAARETDKLAGAGARLFVEGFSNWEITFQRRPQVTSASAEACGDSLCVTLAGSNFGAEPAVDIRTVDSDEVVASYGSHDLLRGNIGQDEVLVFRLDTPELVSQLAVAGLRLCVVNPAEAVCSEEVLLGNAPR